MNDPKFWMDMFFLSAVLFCIGAPLFMFWPGFVNPWKRSKCAEDCPKSLEGYEGPEWMIITALRWTVDSQGVLRPQYWGHGFYVLKKVEGTTVFFRVTDQAPRILDFRDPHFGNEKAKNGFSGVDNGMG